jgi:hypothetical protein
MRVSAVLVGAVVLCTVAVSGESGDRCLDPLPVRMRYPESYKVARIEAPSAWASVASYELADSREQEGMVGSILLTAHDSVSIREFVRQCTEGNASPEASGDVLCIPTPAMFEERRQAIRSGLAPGGVSLMVFRGRRFVVEQHYEEPSGHYIRTYSTFFGDVMLDVRFALRRVEQAREADSLMSHLSFREGVCRRTSGGS